MCGGSAGHINPAISLAEELTRRHKDGVEIFFLTTANDMALTLLSERPYRFFKLPFVALRSKFSPQLIVFLLRLVYGSVQSVGLMLAKRPDAVVGFGAYISGPPLMAACLMRRPTLIHEQNVLPGRANSILSRFMTMTALTFEQTSSRIRGSSVVCGCPVRSSLQPVDKTEALEHFGFEKGRCTVLVMGGSQGAHKVNTVFLDAVKAMTAAERSKIQVLHMSGNADRDYIAWEYSNLAVRNRVFHFFERMELAYSAADIAVSRAGASSIFELAAFGVPSILVPYPHAGAHQVENARYFQQRGAAFIIKENNITGEALRSVIMDLADDAVRRDDMREAAYSTADLNGTAALSDEVEKISGLRG